MARKRATRAEWLERVSEWKAGGRSAEAFARRKKLSRRSLEWWAWKLASEGEKLEPKPKNRPASTRVDFVELLTVPGSVAGLTLRVGRVVVELDRDFDGEVLARVLEVLEARG